MCSLQLHCSCMTNGILPLDGKTINSLKQKHLQSQPAYEETFIHGEPHVIHPIIFDDIKMKN